MPGHAPVLLTEVLDQLGAGEGRRVLDLTFGGGGHTRAFLDAHPKTEVVAFDRDPAAEPRSDALSADFPNRFRFVRDAFDQIEAHPDLGSFDAILADLGLSSFQLDTADRGFSFCHAAPTDMRMDPTSGPSAADFLETASEAELVEAVRDFGEERSWRAVVAAIREARGSGRLQKTDTLADLIAGVVRSPSRGRSTIHPATRTFQGVRIAINEELAQIDRMLPQAFDRLRPGGRLAIISFHSLEDRRIKRAFRQLAGEPVDRFDARPEDERSTTRVARLVSRRALQPSDAEVATNPRARSARLRVLEKLPTS